MAPKFFIKSELAVKSGADIIIYNEKDFNQASKFGIKILMPKKFLEELELIMKAAFSFEILHHFRS